MVSDTVRHFLTKQDITVSGAHIIVGAWCSGITSAPHAEGPGFKSQCVHVCSSGGCHAVWQMRLFTVAQSCVAAFFKRVIMCVRNVFLRFFFLAHDLKNVLGCRRRKNVKYDCSIWVGQHIFLTGATIIVGAWCSGITSAPHAEGPGFKSQCVHVCSSGGCHAVWQMKLFTVAQRHTHTKHMDTTNSTCCAGTTSTLKMY